MVGVLYAIGEVLVDFIPIQKGKHLKDVVSFERKPGGAPANVAAAVAKYGERSSMITKLGEDAFGDFLIEQLQSAGVEVDKISRTKQANTGLAFVSLREDGERDFSFYRNPSSDLLVAPEELDENWFCEGDVLHFCSVALIDSPMKKAHVKAIDSIKQNGGIVSFDPNVRLPLWDSEEECRQTILEFIPKAHIVKISDEELEFITGISNPEEAIATMFKGDVKAVIYTKGSKGASLHLNDGRRFSVNGYKVSVKDTTGAGDAFIGGILYQLINKEVRQSSLIEVLVDYHAEVLSFANASGALTTTKKGAISALPTINEIRKLIDSAVQS